MRFYFLLYDTSKLVSLTESLKKIMFRRWAPCEDWLPQKDVDIDFSVLHSGAYMTVRMCAAVMCPCSSRSPWRRKKNCLLVAIPVMAIIAFMQMIEVDEVYKPLHPLSDAKSEARRLLKIMTHYNYQCNSTSQIGNTSIWPVCIDKGVGLNLDAKRRKLLYTIGLVFSSDNLCLVLSWLWSWQNTSVLYCIVSSFNILSTNRNSYNQCKII